MRNYLRQFEKEVLLIVRINTFQDFKITMRSFNFMCESLNRQLKILTRKCNRSPRDFTLK